jgi:hypothetical protein
MPKGDKTPARFDWPSLYSEFHEAIKENDMISLNAWCQLKQLNYTNTSRQFAEIARLQTAEIGATLAPKAMRKLGALLQSKDEAVSGRTATAILDRTGFSANSQAITVNNNISLGVAMFSKEDEPKLKEMFGGNIIDDTSDPN